MSSVVVFLKNHFTRYIQDDVHFCRVRITEIGNIAGAEVEACKEAIATRLPPALSSHAAYHRRSSTEGRIGGARQPFNSLRCGAEFVLIVPCDDRIDDADRFRDGNIDILEVEAFSGRPEL
jgi:hypothetical protein